MAGSANGLAEPLPERLRGRPRIGARPPVGGWTDLRAAPDDPSTTTRSGLVVVVDLRRGGRARRRTRALRLGRERGAGRRVEHAGRAVLRHLEPALDRGGLGVV